MVGLAVVVALGRAELLGFGAWHRDSDELGVAFCAWLIAANGLISLFGDASRSRPVVAVW